MKKIYFLFLSTILSHSVFSQALPNPGFDNWTNVQQQYDDPDNWTTLNSFTYQLGFITAEKASGADVHSGAAAIKLTTIPAGIQNANGLVTTGTINIVTQTVDGGIPYTLRPDSITGWYKCNPQGADYGFVDFTLFDSNSDTVGFAHFQTPNSVVSTYTRFSVALNYHNANTPSLSRCVISSSAGTNAVPYSEMFIDDLNLVFNPDGISEHALLKNTFSYNSANHKLQVFVHETGHLAVSDITGKKIIDRVVQKGYAEYTMETFPAGLYLYMFSGSSTGQSSSGKFISE